MTDRELLELAAKAAGYVFVVHPGYDEDECVYVTHTWIREPGHLVEWNPLLDDGDALRLAVKMGISIHMGTYKVVCEVVPQEDDGNIVTKENCVSDPYAPTRMAIVRAAAEIGKAMEDQ